MNLDLTYFNSFQVQSSQTEVRDERFGLIPFGKEIDMGASWLDTRYRSEMSTNADRAIDLAAIKDDVITVSTQESFNWPNNFSESEKYSVTKYTIAAGFKVPLYIWGNSMVTQQNYFDDKYKKLFRAMAKKKCEIMETFLEAQKTQVFSVAGAPTGYSFAANKLTVTNAAQTFIMFDTIRTLMEQNNLNDDIAMVASYGLKHATNQLKPYGTNNEKNLINQMPIQTFFDGQITVGGANRFNGFVAQKGAFAMVPNFTPEFLSGANLADCAWGITNFAAPYLNEQVMVFQERAKSDNNSFSASSLTDHAMSIMMGEYFIHKFYLVQKYNSDLTTRVNDIVKIEGTNA